MEPLLLALALVVLVLVLLVIRRVVRRRMNQMIADAPQKVADRLQSDASALGVALSFAEPIAGRSVVSRTLEGKRLATPLAENQWRIGAENIGGVDIEWVVDAGHGVLRATRTRTIAATLAGAGNWTRVITAVEAAATSEGAAVTRVSSGAFVDSGERAGGEQFWVRPAV